MLRVLSDLADAGELHVCDLWGTEFSTAVSYELAQVCPQAVSHAKLSGQGLSGLSSVSAAA